MTISTRGRYAMRVLVDLAEHSDGNYISLKSISERQEISLKYLERIMPVLVQNGLIEGIQGKNGGYRLTRKPEAYTAKEILLLTEGGLAPVACLSCEAETCTRRENCRTVAMWEGLQKVTLDYFENITLKDLMKDEQNS